MSLERIAWKEKRGYHGFAKVNGGEHVNAVPVEDPLIINTGRYDLNHHYVNNALDALRRRRSGEQRQRSLEDVAFYSVNRCDEIDIIGYEQKKEVLTGFPNIDDNIYSVQLFVNGDSTSKIEKVKKELEEVSGPLNWD